MANIGNKIPATHSGSIAGLFKDESKAEKAIEDLRSNGFSEREIGIATAHQEGTIGRFWDNLTNKFGQQEHTEHASDLHRQLPGRGDNQDAGPGAGRREQALGGGNQEGERLARPGRGFHDDVPEAVEF